MNNLRILLAAVFHFVHPVEKRKHNKVTQNSVSFSNQKKFQDAP